MFKRNLAGPLAGQSIVIQLKGARGWEKIGPNNDNARRLWHYSVLTLSKSQCEPWPDMYLHPAERKHPSVGLCFCLCPKRLWSQRHSFGSQSQAFQPVWCIVMFVTRGLIPYTYICNCRDTFILVVSCKEAHLIQFTFFFFAKNLFHFYKVHKSWSKR